jgi:hypothetical protein
VVDVVSQMFAPLVYYVVFPVGVVWLAFASSSTAARRTSG